MATVNLFGDLALDASVQETNDKLGELTATRDTAAAVDQKGIPSFAVRRDADTIPISDGDMGFLALDEEGRLKTANKTASFMLTTGSTNTVSSTVVADTRRASNVVFHLKNTGTAATGATAAFHFEGSIDSTNGTDGTWFRIQAVRSNVNTIDTGTSVIPGTIAAGASALFSWESSVNAYQFMRIICSVAPAASSNAVWTIQRGSYATEPIPAAQASATQAVSLSSTTANLGTITTGTGYFLNTAATTNAAVIKATAGNLYEITVSNPTATPAYVKLYSKATAPTVGTDVPLLTIPIAASAPGAGIETYSFGTTGKRFTLGIVIAVTAAAPATDTAATVAGIQISATYA